MYSPITTLFRRMCAALIALAMTSDLWAGGFSIYEQGARATAQGGAFVARPWDPSAGFYNPAGLAMFGTPGQWRIYAGLTPVQSQARFVGANPFPGFGVEEKAKSKWFPPFDLHAAYQINDQWSAGLSVTTPYGLGTEWNADYSGRFRSILGDIQVVFVSPTFSYKINDQFSVGGAVDYIYSKVKLRRKSQAFIYNQSYDVIDVNLEGTDNASFGWHLGALYKIDDHWSVGVDYKHLVHQKYEGTAKFENIATDPLVAASVTAQISNPLFGGTYDAASGTNKQDGNAKYLNFPNSIVVGVGYKAEKWNTEVDFAYVGWKTFKVIQIEFPENQSLTNSLDQQYDNAWQIRAGFEYWLTEKFAGRLGYIYDKTPAPANTISPLLPDADRHDFSIGVGYKFTERFHVDAAYMAVTFKERSTKNNVDGFDGTYNSHVNLLSFNVGYTFGGN